MDSIIVHISVLRFTALLPPPSNKGNGYHIEASRVQACMNSPSFYHVSLSNGLIIAHGEVTGLRRKSLVSWLLPFGRQKGDTELAEK